MGDSNVYHILVHLSKAGWLSCSSAITKVRLPAVYTCKSFTAISFSWFTILLLHGCRALWSTVIWIICRFTLDLFFVSVHLHYEFSYRVINSVFELNPCLPWRPLEQQLWPVLVYLFYHVLSPVITKLSRILCGDGVVSNTLVFLNWKHSSFFVL